MKRNQTAKVYLIVTVYGTVQCCGSAIFGRLRSRGQFFGWSTPRARAAFFQASAASYGANKIWACFKHDFRAIFKDKYDKKTCINNFLELKMTNLSVWSWSRNRLFLAWSRRRSRLPDPGLPEPESAPGPRTSGAAQNTGWLLNTAIILFSL